MERIAFILEEIFIYRESVILTLAAAAAVCLFLAFWLGRGGSWLAGILAATGSAAVSLVLSRLAHWYFQSAAYPSLEAAMTDYTTGGFALMGVFAGCILVAALLRLLQIYKDLPAMLDCMSLAGAAGIALGRLACMYSDGDRGMVLENVTTLPLAYPVVDPVSGELTYRLATFMLQSIATGAVFLVLVLFWLLRHRKACYRSGDTALLFLAFHGVIQILADSTRYDSLFMRSNGFIGVVQLLGLLALLTAIVFFSVYLVRSRGWRWWYLGLWLPQLAGLGWAGYMEYYVQRHSDQFLFSYLNMGIGLGAALLIALVTYGLSLKPASGD